MLRKCIKGEELAVLLDMDIEAAEILLDNPQELEADELIKLIEYTGVSMDELLS